MTDGAPFANGKNDAPTRIGLFGGTFDPVHFGHLRPALELQQSLSLETLYLLPCHIPAHREQPGASTQQRIDMLRLAIDGVSGLAIDTREAERETFSYSVDTLESVCQQFPATPPVFIMGMDAFAKFTGWHRYQRILEIAHLVIIDRPGSRLSGAEERLLMSREQNRLPPTDAPAGTIVVQKTAQSDISATAIRSLLTKGQDIRYLVPEAVRHYIISNNLYRPG